MTSRERVLAALRHQEADRVPIDLGAMRSSGIQAIAYNRLKAHLGIQGGQTVLYDIMQQLAQPEMTIIDRFHLDALPLPRRLLVSIQLGRVGSRGACLTARRRSSRTAWSRYAGRTAASKSATTQGHILYRMPLAGLYYEPVYEPLAHATTIAEIEAWQPPSISDAELAWLAAEARRLRATTDKAIMGLTGQKIYEGAQSARGWQRFMEDLAGQPALAEALLQRLADAACADLARYLDAVGEFIDIVQVGDDLGTQNGPQLSPRMYRRLVKPYQQQMWQFIKARSGLPVFLHCCGGIYPLIPDLIEAGVDILNPVQISAVGMDPARLKAEFGRDLVFWGGGCDTQHVLPEATPAQVADHVRRQIDILAPGGGFVFNQVHNIQANVPPENIVAMLDATFRYGGY